MIGSGRWNPQDNCRGAVVLRHVFVRWQLWHWICCCPRKEHSAERYLEGFATFPGQILPFRSGRTASPTVGISPATLPADNANSPASCFGPDALPRFVPCCRWFSPPFEPARAGEALLLLWPFLIVAAGVLFRVLAVSLADIVFIGANRSKAVLRPACALLS